MMNTCELCAYSGTPPYKSPCYECFDFDKWEEKEKPMTNADHIRSMSDKNIANFIILVQIKQLEAIRERLSKLGIVLSANNCEGDLQRLKDWLGQPYKEKTDG